MVAKVRELADFQERHILLLVLQLERVPCLPH
jgi:hypothetical protein